jgi:hypothetical protein
VSQHVGVDLHIEAGGHSGTLDQCLKSPLGEGRPALTNEYEGRPGLLLTL